MSKIGLFIKLSDSVEFLCVFVLINPLPYKVAIVDRFSSAHEIRNGCIKG